MPHVTFIHGILNKPAADKLYESWTRSLANSDGLDLGAEGVTSSMVYWADVLYESPMADEPGYENAELSESPDLAIKRAEAEPEVKVSDAKSAKEAAFIVGLSAKLNFAAAVDEVIAPVVAESGPQFERIPLPGWLKRNIMKTYLRDVHHYLFNVNFSPRAGTNYEVQTEIRQRFVAKLKEGASKPGPHIVVSHSMGTVIAYDCLKRVADCPQVDGLITLGSPLGVDEIQDGLQPGWSREDGFPHEHVTGRWVNIYDQLDPVCGLDPRFANDFRHNSASVVTDIKVTNEGKWKHDVTKYLSRTELRTALSGMLGL